MSVNDTVSALRSMIAEVPELAHHTCYDLHVGAGTPPLHDVGELGSVPGVSPGATLVMRQRAYDVASARRCVRGAVALWWRWRVMRTPAPLSATSARYEASWSARRRRSRRPKRRVRPAAGRRQTVQSARSSRRGCRWTAALAMKLVKFAAVRCCRCARLRLL